MTLTFDQNGLQTNTFDEIFSQKVSEYQAIYGANIDVDQESPDGQRIGIETTTRFDVESFISWLYSSIDPDLNNGDMQQIIGKIAGVHLQAASRSQWDLVIESDRARTLPVNYTVTDSDNQNWFLDSEVSILQGNNNVTFLSRLWGDIKGSALGVEFTQATPELGIISVTANADAVTGRTEETEEQFRVRRRRSTENPAQSTLGAIYARLAALPGVSDLAVYENTESTHDADLDLAPHSLWVVIDGGSLDDIGEVLAKQRLGGTKGDIVVTYIDELTRPNGNSLFLTNEHNIDRSIAVDLHVRLTVTTQNTGSLIDSDAIKNRLMENVFFIGEDQQVGALYPFTYIDNFNYISSDLQISLNGTTFTNQSLSPGFGGKFQLSADNINITEVFT